MLLLPKYYYHHIYYLPTYGNVSNNDPVKDGDDNEEVQRLGKQACADMYTRVRPFASSTSRHSTSSNDDNEMPLKLKARLQCRTLRTSLTPAQPVPTSVLIVSIRNLEALLSSTRRYGNMLLWKHLPLFEYLLVLDTYQCQMAPLDLFLPQMLPLHSSGPEVGQTVERHFGLVEDICNEASSSGGGGLYQGLDWWLAGEGQQYLSQKHSHDDCSSLSGAELYLSKTWWAQRMAITTRLHGGLTIRKIQALKKQDTFV